jgi:hypothetical protein
MKYDGGRTYASSESSAYYDGGYHRQKPEYNVVPPFKYSSGSYQERFSMTFDTGDVKEAQRAVLRYNNAVRYDSSENYSPLGNRPAYDTMKMWMKKHHFFSGAYKYDAEILYDSMILIPLE